MFCLVSSAYLSYYMRPWRWLRSMPGQEIPDDPFAQIPLPHSTEKKNSEPVEKTVV
jgi:hypothetical protein